MALRIALLLGTLLALAGCKRLGTGARETFAREYSCPEARVAVTERSDLRYSAFLESPRPGTPAPEVAADPERLARWTSDRQEEHSALMRDLDTSLTVYRVTGCDHEVFMGCAHVEDSEGYMDLSRVNCFTPPLGKKR